MTGKERESRMERDNQFFWKVSTCREKIRDEISGSQSARQNRLGVEAIRHKTKRAYHTDSSQMEHEQRDRFEI